MPATQGGGTGLVPINVSVPITGGPAAPSYAASSAPTSLDLSLPFAEAGFDVGGYQLAYPGQPIDASVTSGAGASSSLPSWALYAGAALLAFVLLHRHAAAPSL
ncbi:MAG TPA: hypothetical protein VNE82_03510 [Candidatus Binataceae bacterium]|nr:hypothetical protein [Candidatus Binataceae bacterium]